MIESMHSTLAFFSMPGHIEWLVILVIALLIFGKRLPELARSVGKSLTEFKKGINEAKESTDDVVDDVKKIKGDVVNDAKQATGLNDDTNTTANRSDRPFHFDRSARWPKIRKILDPTSCTMSLGDHLEELRARLILALLGLSRGHGRQPHLRHVHPAFIEMTVPQGDARTESRRPKCPRVRRRCSRFVGTFFDTLTERLATDPNAAAVDLDPKREAFCKTCRRRPSRRG